MSEKHTQGRLIVRCGYSIYADEGKTPVADTCLTASVPDNDEANARRLVACWNACEGISTEALERSDVIASMQGERRRLETQRDDLLAALKAARQSLEVANDEPGGPIRDTIWHGPAETLFDFIDAAIAKATNPD